MNNERSEVIRKVVNLGNLVRKYKSEGQLGMVPPPTIYGYLSFLRMAESIPEMSLQDIALATLLGNTSADDKKHVSAILNQVFGINIPEEDESGLGSNLF